MNLPRFSITTVMFLLLVGLVGSRGRGQDLLPGEFGEINLGREMIGADRFPTIQQFRRLVRKPAVETAVMIRLFGNEHNHAVPAWSHDGTRLAIQQTNVGQDTSEILLYRTMGQRQPETIARETQAYDYMFRWGLNEYPSFVFARLNRARQSTRLHTSFDSYKVDEINLSGFAFSHPALYVRSDGIRRVAFDRQGMLAHAAWDANARLTQPTEIGRGTSPRWSRDGQRLLAIHTGDKDPADQQLVTVDIQSRQFHRLKTPSSSVLRSPAWSPDERYASCYYRPRGVGTNWSIVASPIAGEEPERRIDDDVVVNQDFTTAGPGWQPDGSRVWYFSHANRNDAYYPLVAVHVASGQKILVDYPAACTSPTDLAVNPVTQVPEIAFVAHRGITRDLFIVLLNHF